MRITVGTLNLWSGRRREDGRVDHEALAEAIDALDVDVLAVQEVDRFQERSGTLDQAAFVAERFGAVWYRHVDTVVGTPAGHRWPVPSGGGPPLPEGAGARSGYGIALLSRLPVLSSDVLALPRSRHRYPALIPGPPPRLVRVADEPRAAVRVTLAEPALTIACTHLSVLPWMSSRQLVQVARWLGTGPAVLLGDLNLPRRAARRLTNWTPLVREATFPAARPLVQLDNVLATRLPPGARAVGRAVLLPVSDHRGVVAEVGYPD
ncbi:MAG: endonuclease/exonuclease/phosphatase family protein [Kineosporiaceae bacterium]